MFKPSRLVANGVGAVLYLLDRGGDCLAYIASLIFPPEQPGGVSSMVPYIQERFNRVGWEMELFSLPKRVRNKGQEEVAFATFDAASFAGNPIVDKYIQTYRDYLWWTKMRIKRSYDLIHAHHPIAALVMRQLFPDTPIMMTIHSSFERELILNNRITEGSPEHRFLTSIYRELETKVDRLLTVSESFRQYMAPYLEQPDNVIVIPNGFDEKRFKPIAHENQVTQFITVCRLVPAKGLDVLLKACAILKQKGYPFVLHIIGDGPIRAELEQLAVDLGLYDEIIFMATCFIQKNLCRSLTYSYCLHAPNRSDQYSQRPHFAC